MSSISRAVESFVDRGHEVLSPADPRIVDSFGDFLFVASDLQKSIRLVQSRHLQAIAMADFLWLVCPDGYVGVSASMEIGFAVALGRDIFSTTPPSDLTLRQYVICVPNLDDAIRRRGRAHPPSADLLLLVDPLAAADEAHRLIDDVSAALLRPSTAHESDDALRAAVDRLDTISSVPQR